MGGRVRESGENTQPKQLPGSEAGDLELFHSKDNSHGQRAAGAHGLYHFILQTGSKKGGTHGLEGRSPNAQIRVQRLDGAQSAHAQDDADAQNMAGAAAVQHIWRGGVSTALEIRNALSNSGAPLAVYPLGSPDICVCGLSDSFRPGEHGG